LFLSKIFFNLSVTYVYQGKQEIKNIFKKILATKQKNVLNGIGCYINQFLTPNFYFLF
jgi:hypothetical protein